MNRNHIALPLALAIAGLSACGSQGRNSEEGHEVPVANRPAISLSTAIATAQTQEPTGRVLSAEVENEDGRVICSVLLAVAGGAREVNIDATSGGVIGTESEPLESEVRALLGEIDKDPHRVATTAVQAIEAALKAASGTWALEAELCSEDGVIVYDVHLMDGHEGKVARIAAGDGRVVRIAEFEEEDEEAESEHQEADERD